MAEISYFSNIFNNPLYLEEMQAIIFFDQPHIALGETLLLKFRPRNMDILPLYIILLLIFPIVLVGLRHCCSVIFGGSLFLYVMARTENWNLPAYPEGSGWFFNPFAWQFLFVLGAWCGSFHRRQLPILLYSNGLLFLAVLYILFSLAVVMTWHDPGLAVYMPMSLAAILYPIDKSGLDPLRLFHFLALALIIVRLVPDETPFRRWWLARRVIVCGQHSLQVFCAGTVLAFLGQFALIEVDPSSLAQLLVSAFGIAAMVILAHGLLWYRQLNERVRLTKANPETAKKKGSVDVADKHSVLARST
jgi:hypothetical protein